MDNSNQFNLVIVVPGPSIFPSTRKFAQELWASNPFLRVAWVFGAQVVRSDRSAGGGAELLLPRPGGCEGGAASALFFGENSEDPRQFPVRCPSGLGFCWEAENSEDPGAVKSGCP